MRQLSVVGGDKTRQPKRSQLTSKEDIILHQKKAVRRKGLLCVAVIASLAFCGIPLTGSVDTATAQEPIKIETSFPTSGTIPYWCATRAQVTSG